MWLVGIVGGETELLCRGFLLRVHLITQPEFLKRINNIQWSFRMNRMSDFTNSISNRDSELESLNCVFSNYQVQPCLLKNLLEDLINGILILTEQGELIYINNYARQILQRLIQNDPPMNFVPGEIWHICQCLIQSRSLFPNQHWSIESEVLIDHTITLHVQARWLNTNLTDVPSLLLIVKDQHRSIRNMINEEAQKYGLTSREKEIWLLHRAGYTYKQIATELQITPNTVKKHLKSIRVKQKLAVEMEGCS
jgi:DNA-binding CsgD family transcriptional regulator